jgi:hypothetical protein
MVSKLMQRLRPNASLHWLLRPTSREPNGTSFASRWPSSTWLPEPHVTDRAFGPADPLRHCRLRHEIALGDLPGGQATNGAQREGHRGRRGQRRMGAQEEELQRVVYGLGRSGRRLGQQASW